MTTYDEEEATPWTTLGLVFTIIIACLGYRFFGPDTIPEPVRVQETRKEENVEEKEKDEEPKETPSPVIIPEPAFKLSETINEDKEESNSTGSSEFERISNSEANDMPAEEEQERVVEEGEATINEEPKAAMEETQFMSFVDTTLESKPEPEKETEPQSEEEECAVESPESEDSKVSMLVNFDSIHDADEDLEAPKEDIVEAEPVAESEPVIPQAVVSEATEQTEETKIEERSNSPSIRTEPSDDEDPLEEVKSSSPILVSDQDVEMSKQVAESVPPVSVQQEAIDREEADASSKKAVEERVSGAEAVDTEEDVVKAIDIAKVDAAIDELMGDMNILPKDETKLSQAAPVEVDIEEKPIVPIDVNATEKNVADESQDEFSLTGIQEITSIADESAINDSVAKEDTLELMEKTPSEPAVSSAKDDTLELMSEPTKDKADESLSGIEEIALPDLDCTETTGEEFQQGNLADDTILSSAGEHAPLVDLSTAAEEKDSEKEIKKQQLEAINKMLEQHGMLGEGDVKVDEQVKMYTG
ncbi:Oidioi.mRNA.OKI2018_I69.XSR.g13841.t1.cds [Oikopleura dioica]|uniref:Oidioi.mRNA.OKI2018_I69.XSR.g13841.t1.cds n=1 Tax=Oikopleura dioica TaxID=34765 RepID=A0ABN7SCU2_OIKDI|nr:Oidioi.mRNA.OKI2018_I69.XSR.g13841.t1.cds [Oikopleura dioica]